MEKISVLGAGIMGHSIALNAAWAGYAVTLWGTDDRDLSRAMDGIAGKAELLHASGLTEGETPSEIVGRVAPTADLAEAVRGATFIIEAIPEDLALKQQLYRKLDRMCDPSVILASNTSGLSPTAISAEMEHPERMVVTHFWNPAHLIPLVEVVRGKHTSDGTVKRAMDLLLAWNKKPIEVRKDVPGFVANRLQYAMFREAQYLLEEGVASVEDIDAAVCYSIGRRLPVTGPFMTADMGGLDVFHAISEYLFRDLCKADGSLERMRGLVESGSYGIKNGKGFYDWDAERSREISRKREETLVRFLLDDRNAGEGTALGDR